MMRTSLAISAATVGEARGLGPWHGDWGKGALVALSPTPLELQPSAYVQAAWRNRPYGQTPGVLVHIRRAPRALLLRLEWACPAPRFAVTDNNEFADACAVLFSKCTNGTPLETMGSPERPVIAWQWQSGVRGPFVLDAHGVGTAERRKEHSLEAAAEWRDDRWAVVFTYPALPGEPLPCSGGRLAFAVWSGANEERAGIAAWSPEWQAMTVEAPLAGVR